MPKTSKQKARAKAKIGAKKGMGVGLQIQKQGGGRVSVKSLMGHPIFGGRLTSNVDSIPSAFVNILGNSTYYDENNRVMMPELGISPVNIVGCQPLTDITGAVATADVFTASTIATIQGVNTINITPDTLNGPVAAKANFYDKYVFRDILIEYVSTCATTQVSALALAISEDLQNVPTTFSTVRQCVPSVTFPFRADRAFLHYHYRGYTLWYNLLDTGSGPSQRLTIQSVLTGYPSANLTVISPGFLNIYYSLDLYDPISTQGFSVSVKRDERDIIKSILENIRTLDIDDKVMILKDLLVRSTSFLPPKIKGNRC